MKASIKLSEEDPRNKPVFRAKLPLNILGFPFQYGVSAGDPQHEFSLSLSTFFRSAPTLKFSYRPTDSRNPLALVLKLGTGPFASPISAPVTLSAEFDPLDRGKAKLFLKFRPEFGDFTIKKSFRSPPSDNVSGTRGSVGLGDTSDNRRGKIFTKDSPRSAIDGVLSGLEFCARTVIPVPHRNVLKFRWGVRFPTDFESMIMVDVTKDRKATISSRKFPFLVMSKISIEHVAAEGGLDSQSEAAEAVRSEFLAGKSD